MERRFSVVGRCWQRSIAKHVSCGLLSVSVVRSGSVDANTLRARSLGKSRSRVRHERDVLWRTERVLSGERFLEGRTLRSIAKEVTMQEEQRRCVDAFSCLADFSLTEVQARPPIVFLEPRSGNN